HDAAFGAETELGGALEALHRLADGVEEAGRRHRVFAFFAGKGFPFNQERAAAGFGCDTHFGCGRFIAFVDVAFEYVVRFHQVSIYVGDFKSVFHGDAPNTSRLANSESLGIISAFTPRRSRSKSNASRPCEME